MNMNATAIERPPLLYTAMELARCSLEATALLLSTGVLAHLPRGDNHHVMVLPGFATDDNMTAILRGFLSMLGYQVHPWKLGWNLDHRTVGDDGEHVAARIEEIAGDTGHDVSLIGWSLGGVIAREAARRKHSGLRQVITLGSPFTGDPTATSLRGLYELLSGNDMSAAHSQERYIQGRQPLKVPSTAIYSKSDGITAWENCRSMTDPITENIAVHSSHFGLVVNPTVFYIIADRLAQPEGDWKPFDRNGPFSLFFPVETDDQSPAPTP